MKMMKYSNLKILVILYCFLSCRTGSDTSLVDHTFEKKRLIILSDMTHDDGNSLIRLLYYAPFFDIEALIVTNQLPDYQYDDDAPFRKAMQILDAYEVELPQLRKHDQGFPEAKNLMAVCKKGNGALPILWLTNDLKFSGQIGNRFVDVTWDSVYFHDWIGEGLTPNGEPKDSPGSEFLQEVFAKDDDRPIYVQAWGGTITFVQALYRYRQRFGEDKFNKLLQKIHLYGILFQDITFEYFVGFNDLREKSCPWFGTAISTYNEKPFDLGMVLFDAGHFWHYCCSADTNWRRPISASEVNGYGPMSDLYDNGGEGDTPAFLYLISAALGLNDPLDPTQGSWGSMFKPIDGTQKGYYHTCNVDLNELTRWIPDATNSFKNRLQWSVKTPDEVNHEPVVTVNGNRKNVPIYIDANPGETIILDASKSFDPDGDELNFNWFRYDEADHFQEDIIIEYPSSDKQKIIIPDTFKNSNIHIVLEVRDNGEPALVNYQRIIIQNKM